MTKDTVLLIEDDQLLSKTIIDFLALAGIEITNVYNGNDGKKLIQKKVTILSF